MEISIDSSPSESKLQSLNVFKWPIWTKEISLVHIGHLNTFNDCNLDSLGELSIEISIIIKLYYS